MCLQEQRILYMQSSPLISISSKIPTWKYCRKLTARFTWVRSVWIRYSVLVYTQLRRCLRNVTVAASELEKHFVVVPWPMLYKGQALWNEESTAVWEIETEWNPSLLPWLFVVVRQPYPSPHKQMVASLACQVYENVRVSVRATRTRRYIRVYVTAHKIVRGNNMVGFIPIRWKRLLENIPPYLPQQRLYGMLLCLLQILSQGKRAMGFDLMYAREDVIQQPCYAADSSGEWPVEKTAQSEAADLNVSCTCRPKAS